MVYKTLYFAWSIPEKLHYKVKFSIFFFKKGQKKALAHKGLMLLKYSMSFVYLVAKVLERSRLPWKRRLGMHHQASIMDKNNAFGLSSGTSNDRYQIPFLIVRFYSENVFGHAFFTEIDKFFSYVFFSKAIKFLL